MSSKPLAIAVFAALVVIGGVSTGFAAAADYEFQPVAAQAKAGNGTEIAVRLVHKGDNKPVAGAVLFRTRLDMSPDSMAEMVGKLEAMPTSEPGVYKFKADLSMAGGWALHIQAKVPGEAETVEGTVVFQAKD